MLRIRDFYPGSESIVDPGSRVKKIPEPGSALKNLCIVNSKNCFLALRNMIWDLDFLPIPDPGSRGHKGRIPDPGSGSATLLNCHEHHTQDVFAEGLFAKFLLGETLLNFSFAPIKHSPTAPL
jgi:hypothetical protein